MVKKPRRWKSTLEDGDFLSNLIREFSLGPPSYFDETIEKLKHTLTHPKAEPGLTAIEFILRQIENEAKKILQEYGYPIDIDELVPWLQESEGFWWTDPESGFTHFHENHSIQALSAKEVLISAEKIRYEISKNNAEETAIETMRLLFAAMAADLRDVIMDGARNIQGRTRGGKASKMLLGVLKAIWDIINQKGIDYQAQEIWSSIEAAGTDGILVQTSDKTFNVYIDGNKIVQIDDKTGREQSRKYRTFQDYVTKIKKSIKDSQ